MRDMRTVTWFGLGAAVCILVSSNVARADEPAAGSGTATATVSTSAAPGVTATATATGAKEDTTTDHDKVVGHLAVGWFGIAQLPIGQVAPGAGGTGFDAARDNVNAPVIGARYWLSRGIGIDAGLGFGTAGGSHETVNGSTTTTVDKASKLGFALHGGVPIALAYGKHYTFEVVPEATVGFTSGTLKSAAPNGPDTSLSGFRLDVGARIGAEVHFGFIGIPELALQGSVGLYVRRESYKVKSDQSSASDGTTTLATTVGADPWALFTNSISALYYF
jgi:hypothetical protein